MDCGPADNREGSEGGRGERREEERGRREGSSVASSKSASTLQFLRAFAGPFRVPLMIFHESW